VAVGAEVGAGAGAEVGAGDGAGVGAAETVGDDDGSAVGSEVGSGVGSGDGDPMQVDGVRSHGKLPSLQMESHKNWLSPLLSRRLQVEGAESHKKGGTMPVSELS
jgi:hypothetical protein